MPAGFTPPPSGNDWGAFAYGSPVPQPNGFVTGPDSSTDGNLAVFDGTTGNRIKDGGAPSGGGSYLVANTARVDPEGDDETGTVGDLTKPFLTVQAAIDAIQTDEPIGGYYPYPVLDIGSTVFDEEVITTLTGLVIRGTGEYNQVGPGFTNLTVNGVASGITLLLDGVYIGDIISTFASSSEILLRNSFINGDITAAADVVVTGLTGIEPGVSPSITGTIDAPGNTVSAYGPLLISQIGNSKSCNANLVNCQVDTVSVDNLTIQDSRPLTDWSTWEWNTLTTSDKLLNPAWMDFSTLPQATSEPAIDTGKAWIDTTGGDNIVKVKL